MQSYKKFSYFCAMRTLAIIPSRYKSSRFPGKPLVDIAGKCMIQRVYEQTEKAFKEICVATDDIRIFDKVKEFGGNVVMTSASHASGTDRCNEAYHTYLKESNSAEFDLIINVQGDEPLINPLQLKDLEKAFLDSKQLCLATMAKQITKAAELFNKNIPKIAVDLDGYALYFSRSTIPNIRDIDENEWVSNHEFLKHTGLYAYRPKTLDSICKMERTPLEKLENLEQLRWLENGLKIKVIKSTYESFAIDTPLDLEKLIALLA